MNAYDGVEDLDSFSPDELAAYRKILLEKTKPQVEFIERHIGRATLLDLGCGNGRLVICGWLNKLFSSSSMGVDISRSRVEFARAWAGWYAIPTSFHQQDITKLSPSWASGTTLVTCITGAPNYFSNDTLASLLIFMKRQLSTPNGKIVLELYKMPVAREKLLSCNNWKMKTWYELPIEDKFCYYLEDFQYDPIKRVLRHEKTFVSRDGKIDTGRVETLHYYTELEVRLMLSLAGFKKVEFYGDWDDSPYSEELSDKMVVIASL